MNIQSFPDNTSQAENFKDGSSIRFTLGQNTMINLEFDSTIFDRMALRKAVKLTN